MEASTQPPERLLDLLFLVFVRLGLQRLLQLLDRSRRLMALLCQRHPLVIVVGGTIALLRDQGLKYRDRAIAEVLFQVDPTQGVRRSNQGRK
jgi:hypothetical protein